MKDGTLMSDDSCSSADPWENTYPHEWTLIREGKSVVRDSASENEGMPVRLCFDTTCNASVATGVAYLFNRTRTDPGPACWVF
ncbi:hypothetical protein RB4722 [Rhodopirellula baltica SH 1]|uniref:Uncharacterized protein n=1 Tax=Rhodopirellula baltica (strain DSM 10527 / NCIMB 13988 / SH1) TaxID=243090 RepID=Q7US43_RHOBA|nr:hypothetical protein RB4722 [Rhodopirellula baltica SH 1]